MILEVEPALRRSSEISGKPEGGIGRDAAAAAHDFIQPGGIDGQSLGELVDAHVPGLQNVFPDDLAGMNGGNGFGIVVLLLVIVYDLYFCGVVGFVPDKADPVLIVNLNAVLSLAVAIERFEMIPRNGRAISAKHTKKSMCELEILSPIRRATCCGCPPP